MRFIIGILVAIGMIILIFFFIFRGGGNEQQAEQARIDLNNYVNTDASVQLYVGGRVTANENFRSYRINVSRTAATMQVYQGYEQTITAERTTPNNQMAYTDFIRAISRLGFTDVNADAPDDERGFCPSGERYILRLVEGDREIYRGWTTSCGRNQGNFQGDASTIRVLFRQQIPEYPTLVSGSGLT